MIKLSIVVPIYNVEEYLGKCIESLLNQDYKDYEIILVNDGSKDNSEKIAKEYQKKHKGRIKLFTKENGGLSSARNFGIEKASGEYIFFVDSDDYIKENCLATIMKKVQGKDILVFNYLNIFTDREEIFETFDENISDPKAKMIIGSPSACNKIFKLSLFKDNKISFPEGMFYEDLATTPLLCQNAEKIVFDKNTYYCYLQREGSIMHQQKYNKKIEDIFDVFERLDNNFTKKFKEQYKQEIEYVYIWHLLRNASLRFLDFNKIEFLEKINQLINNKFPKWRKNIYYRKYDLKRKVMCNLIMLKQYKVLQLIRNRGVNK